MKQISNFKKSIPDGERFLQEPLYQCSCRRANAYIGGQNPLTWEGIYQEAHTVGVKETFLVGDIQTLVYLMRGIAVSMGE